MMITIPAARSGSGSTAQIIQADIDRRQVGLFQRLVQQLPQLDFCGLARSQGVQAVSVTSVEQLDDALLAAFNSDVPMLVEVAVEQASTAE